jgi:hypothetical protein
MKADVQFGSFTHAKCFNCNHLGQIESFDSVSIDIAKSTNITMTQLVLICPICKDQHCEGVFPNEVN